MARRDEVAEVMDRLGHVFADPALLDAALTHASYCNEAKDPLPDNERLEFLGDAVLTAVVAAAAYERFPGAREGALTRLKASVVSEPALAEAARRLRLGEGLRLGRGAAQGDRVHETASVLADAFEAVVAAVYLDGGFEAARRFVLAQLGPVLAAGAAEAPAGDAKSALQVLSLKAWHVAPRYVVESQSGPSHDPRFTVRATLPDGRGFTGNGRSKKEAEQAAAAEALDAVRAEATGETR